MQYLVVCNRKVGRYHLKYVTRSFGFPIFT
ncbi:hypothetical protein KL86PLE_40254 [uncultured Pleomorphomonas sp.]|uniref:Uncharacterized protein n=1 Tax=uncultured Pleomorphomonas sp. TaxID=442121 RepID=A0A212LGD5_9HYPH|nr:hypothetical protein KL86PLE_40254 [uncultured Pleomorphomonas sp.]